DEDDCDNGDCGGTGKPRVTAADLNRQLPRHSPGLRRPGWAGSVGGRDGGVLSALGVPVLIGLNVAESGMAKLLSGGGTGPLGHMTDALTGSGSPVRRRRP